MEYIRIAIEQMLIAAGLHGSAVPVLRHVLLIIAAVLLAFMSYVVCRHLFVPVIRKIVEKTEAKWDDIVFNDQVLISACRIVPAIVIWKLLPMVFYQFPTVRELLARATAIYITAMTVGTLGVMISSFNQFDNTKRRGTRTQQYLKSFCGLLRIVLYFVATIIIVAIAIGKNPASLFAGLGATSAILMLVFKDTIEGLVAGVRLTSNDMLHKGDWITVPGTTVNGIVREMTLTTVKVQNFDNTIVTISPIALVNGSFQNWIGMQEGAGRRVQRKVYFDFRSIKFTDDDRKQTNIGLFRRDMEQWLRSLDVVNADMTLMVRELEATQCGVPLEFYFFLKEKTWVTYEEQLAGIMEHIYVVASNYGLKIYQQYPEQ